MAKRRPPSSFELTPQEDLFSPGGPEILKVGFLYADYGLVANLSIFFYPHARPWTGTPDEQHRWENLVRDALIRSVDAGAVKAEIHVGGRPLWLRQLLQGCGFKYQGQGSPYMYADLR